MKTIQVENKHQFATFSIFFRYAFGGRGWKILHALEVILSGTGSSQGLPFLKDEDGKEFVDLLISLYQVRKT